MYLVGRLIETKGAPLVCLENPKGLIGYMPIYKTEKAAQKNCFNKFPIYRMEPKTKE